MSKVKDYLVYGKEVTTSAKSCSRIVILAVFLGLLLSSAISQGADLVMFQGHGYQVVTEKATWLEADARARRAGGHLVTINSREENTFIFDLAKKSGSGRAFWIGLTDSGHEGFWTWVTGEPLTFSAWGKGEPNNDGNGEHYANVGWVGNYLWNDANETNKKRPLAFVVEYERVPQTSRSHRYIPVKENVSWHDAVKRANAMGGHLVTIRDVKENRFVFDLAKQAGLGRAFWIGLSDASREGRWVWVTGEPLTFTAWGAGEPNNDNNQENYVNVGWVGNYLWNDANATNKNRPLPFVVEIE